MDYYEADPRRLQRTPKKTIADYVEQNGILVPRRFTSLREARASGVFTIARSEHEQDYAGVSGIFESLRLEDYANIQNEDELKDIVIRRQHIFYLSV